MFFNEVWWNWASSGFTVLTTTTTTQPRCITLSDTWSCTFTNATTVQTFYVCLMFRAHWAFRKHLWVFNPGFHKCSLCFTSVCVSSLSMSFFREDKLCPFFFKESACKADGSRKCPCVMSQSTVTPHWCLSQVSDIPPDRCWIQPMQPLCIQLILFPSQTSGWFNKAFILTGG